MIAWEDLEWRGGGEDLNHTFDLVPPFDRFFFFFETSTSTTLGPTHKQERMRIFLIYYIFAIFFRPLHPSETSISTL